MVEEGVNDILTLDQKGCVHGTYKIRKGDRIAQMVIAKCEQAEPVQVETLTETERGAGGFGHTGKN